MLQASLSAGPDFSDSSVDTKVIFFDFALHNKIVRAVASDILYRLRKEEHERADVFRRCRQMLVTGICENDYIHRLTRGSVI
jgi:hypothetical protein